MKKLFTMLTVVAISTTLSFAQQGSVAIGVGSNLADVSWQDYSLTPTVGYFITDNMMVGTGFSMGSSSEEENDVEYKSGGMNISPFFRFYMNDAFFASAGIAIGSTSSESDASSGGFTITTEDKTSTFGLNVGVGYSLMWNDRICIEPSLGIATGSGSSLSKYTDGFGGVTENESDAPTTFGMAIGLGINIRLGGE
jgi:outer membrane protein